MELNQILKNRRIDLGKTMKEVADYCGVSEATVSRWESGDIENMRRDRIAAYAKALAVSPSVIMGWEEPEPTMQLTTSERDLIRAYRSASDDTQAAVCAVLGLKRDASAAQMDVS